MPARTGNPYTFSLSLFCRRRWGRRYGWRWARLRGRRYSWRRRWSRRRADDIGQHKFPGQIRERALKHGRAGGVAKEVLNILVDGEPWTRLAVPNIELCGQRARSRTFGLVVDEVPDAAPRAGRAYVIKVQKCSQSRARYA